ncbi:MAG: patatin-like phospholipase family protein [Cytophagaceae bacterium]|nr:patatin-like phospholipase family protein [Cytophagaceae bacterium]
MNSKGLNTKKALIFSGGSVKGAFQAGAFKAVVEAGYFPDFIYGISVGSLNGAYVCNEAGKQNSASIGELDWNLMADNLINFWKKNITSPGSIAVKYNDTSLFAHIWFNRFHGLLDTTPIQNLIKENIKIEYLKKSPVGFQAGAVNISNGEIAYVDASDPDFVDYLLASSAIPIIMPVVYIRGDKNRPYVDGGLRDVAPLKKAIDSGADEIICIACYPETFAGGDLNPRNLGQLAERVMDIAINEITNNDIEWANFFNKYLPESGKTESSGPLKGYRKVKLTIIRPEHPINVDIQNFKMQDIEKLIRKGYESAKEKMLNSM